jgi:hypothetical protein
VAHLLTAPFHGPFHPSITNLKWRSWNHAEVNEGPKKSTSSSRYIDTEISIFEGRVHVNAVMALNRFFQGFTAPTSGCSSTSAHGHVLFDSQGCRGMKPRHISSPMSFR